MYGSCRMWQLQLQNVAVAFAECGSWKSYLKTLNIIWEVVTYAKPCVSHLNSITASYPSTILAKRKLFANSHSHFFSTNETTPVNYPFHFSRRWRWLSPLDKASWDLWKSACPAWKDKRRRGSWRRCRPWGLLGKEWCRLREAEKSEQSGRRSNSKGASMRRRPASTRSRTSTVLRSDSFASHGQSSLLLYCQRYRSYRNHHHWYCHCLTSAQSRMWTVLRRCFYYCYSDRSLRRSCLRRRELNHQYNHRYLNLRTSQAESHVSCVD